MLRIIFGTSSLAQDRYRWQALVNAVMNLRCGEFLDKAENRLASE